MKCFICGFDNKACLETHHIIPKRRGGSNDESNTVTLCANCHRAVESIYNAKFWNEIDIPWTDRGESSTVYMEEDGETIYNPREDIDLVNSCENA